MGVNQPTQPVERVRSKGLATWQEHGSLQCSAVAGCPLDHCQPTATSPAARPATAVQPASTTAAAADESTPSTTSTATVQSTTTSTTTTAATVQSTTTTTTTAAI